MTDSKQKTAAALDSTPPFRKTSNLLSLAVAAYREGDVDTAFDLFISGMESHLVDGETADLGNNFAALIEAALAEARNVTEDAMLDAAEVADARPDFPLDEEGLLAGLDEVEIEDENDNAVLGNLADLDAVA